MRASSVLAVLLALGGCKLANPQIADLTRSSGRPADAVSGAPPAAVSTEPGMALPPGGFHLLETPGEAAGLAGIVVGTGSVPLNDVVVYFTDPDERYFAVPAASAGARPVLLAIRTDGLGRFATAPVFEKGQAVLANALLPLNRRLVGLGTAGDAGDLGVTVGSSYVVEFLRDALASPSALTFPAALAREDVRAVVRAQSERAAGLIRGGKLPEPADGPEGDLTMGNGAALAALYAASALSRDRLASDAWKGVLGRRVIPLTTLAGNFRLRFNDGGAASGSTAFGLGGPAGVAQGPPGDDAVYVAERSYFRVKRIQDGAISTVAGAFSGNPTTVTPATAQDGTEIGNADLGDVQEVKIDALGNLLLTFKSAHFVGFMCRQGGSYYGRTLAGGTFYRLGASDGKEGWVDGPLAAARFRNPAGLALDEAGNLFVADRRNNRIRRIDRDSGEVTTVLGNGWPMIAGKIPGTGSLPTSATFTLAELGLVGEGTIEVPDFGSFVDQPTGGDGAGLQASFNRPLALAWRKVSTTEELYVYDSFNQAIRKAVVDAGKSFTGAAVTTLAGAKGSYTHAAGYSVGVGLAGPAADVVDLVEARFDLASYKPDDLAVFQVVGGGLALDAELERLFVTDTNNRAIRMIDLAGKKVYTVARNDSRSVEGDARRVILSGELAGMAVLRDHGLVFADYGSHVVRRLHLQFGL